MSDHTNHQAPLGRTKWPGPVQTRQTQHGFSFIGLLVLVATMGVLLATASDVWQTTRQRDKEEELLFAGNQFRQAIGRYYDQSPQTKTFPKNLDDLLKDPRYPNTRRYLRKIYADPITGSTDWGLVKGPYGEIYGVYSKSVAEPLKKSNFHLVNISFEGRKKYSEWQFIYAQGQTRSNLLQTPAGHQQQ